MDPGNRQTTPAGDRRIKLNVGGKLFETTASTLRSGGPDSLLSALSSRPHDGGEIFIDRDPDTFSSLLSLLRSNHLPSSSLRRFSLLHLSDEASYFGIEPLLRSSLSPPPFSGVDARHVTTLRPSLEGHVTALEGRDASLLVAHGGGQLSAYDWGLAHVGTIRTHVDDISAVCSTSPHAAAIGSGSSPGLHFYSLADGRRIGSVDWTDPTDPRVYKARVGAICNEGDSVFAAFDCPHRENAVLQVDKSTLDIVFEIGRQKGGSTKSIVPSKIAYLPDPGVIFGCSVTSSAFGFSGYVRLWDPRTGGVVWETNEPGSGRSSRFGDSFADVDVDGDEKVIFKVCSKSGDLAMADLRKLGDDPWVYMIEKNPSLRHNNVGISGNCVLHCYKKQVFVAREGGLEVWSRVEEREGDKDRDTLFHKEAFRRNFVDKVEDSERGVIRKIQGGGDRLFVCREDVEGVEVWESSNVSGTISVPTDTDL